MIREVEADVTAKSKSENSEFDPDNWCIPNLLNPAMYWRGQEWPEDGATIFISDSVDSSPHPVGPRRGAGSGFVSIAGLAAEIGNSKTNDVYKINLVLENTRTAQKLIDALSEATTGQTERKQTKEVAENSQKKSRDESIWDQLQGQWAYPTVIGLHDELAIWVRQLEQIAHRIEETLAYLPRDLEHESSINQYQIDLDSDLGRRILSVNEAYSRQILNSVREAVTSLENAYQAALDRYST